MAEKFDGYLYRLLREDENPLIDGIMGKTPLRDKEPVYHIRHCFSPFKSCQWISTCASKVGLNQMKHLKQTMIQDERLDDVSLRYVRIDKKDLEVYAEHCIVSTENDDKLAEVIDGAIVRYVPQREMTGRIFDFTDESIVKNYLPERPKGNIERSYAAKYREVLVERFIPPHCCVEVVDEYMTDPMTRPSANDRTDEKEFRLKSEFL